ncbi:enoyl-CoA hydratase/isomerase family protein [Saccharopolyspora sp. NPDC050389]|uniref:enoyl-CoA hydratase/isomerase family protein n=1 Tax=Saccharopolyspora sp. NPDC050389 TaxID=3155516 RepID=UPI00340EC21E
MHEPTDPVLVEHDAGVSVITLNRPRRRNALTADSVRRLAAAVTEALAEDGVGALLLRGAGGSFCSGIDLRDSGAVDGEALDPEWLRRFHAEWSALHGLLAAADKPVVAALEGAAVNAGAALALSADLLIAGRGAFLQIAEVQRNMVARINIAWLCARYGSARALDLTLTGRRADGAELHRLGIAHACAADDAVVADALDLAKRLAAYPRSGVAETKRLVRALELASGDPGALLRVAADPTR